MWWRFLIVLFSFVLIGAHFLRDSHYIAAIISCILPFVLFIKVKKVYTFLEYFLYISSIFVWIWTAVNFVSIRLSHGEPWIRLAFIMLAVTLYTIYSGYCIRQLNSKLSKNS